LNNFDEGLAQDSEFCIPYLKKYPEKSEKKKKTILSLLVFCPSEENLTVEKSQAKPRRLAKHPCSTGL